jgi:hypothetical protein
MYKFADTTELLIHATGTVEQAVNSLRRDVKNCLRNKIEPAPFPAILFCFSTVNLLGALVAGRADKNAPNKEISICYMTRFMHYSHENAEILIDLFRHKLVHLAQPRPVIRYGPEVMMTWATHHNNRSLHLKRETLPQGSVLDGYDILPGWDIRVTHRFNISIMDFTLDIKDSAMGSNGYLKKLKHCPDLQAMYKKAINQIYGDSTLSVTS